MCKTNALSLKVPEEAGNLCLLKVNVVPKDQFFYVPDMQLIKSDIYYSDLITALQHSISIITAIP